MYLIFRCHVTRRHICNWVTYKGSTALQHHTCTGSGSFIGGQNVDYLYDANDKEDIKEELDVKYDVQDEDEIDTKNLSVEHELTYKQWVTYFVQYPILREKQKTKTVNSEKAIARAAIVEKIREELQLDITTEQVRKSFNNKKTRLQNKMDSRKTGNTSYKLDEDEEQLRDYLDGLDGQGSSSTTALNPQMHGLPNAIEVGVANGARMRKEPADISQEFSLRESER